MSFLGDIETNASNANLLVKMSSKLPSAPIKLELEPIQELVSLIDEWGAKPWPELQTQPLAMWHFCLYLRSINQEAKWTFCEDVEKFRRAKSSVAVEVEMKTVDENGKKLFNERDSATLSRKTRGNRIVEQYLTANSDSGANALGFADAAVIEKAKADLQTEEVAAETFDVIYNVCQDSFRDGITDFKQSSFFETFIQQKVFCQRPYKEEHLFKIRVLGRGAFGAVHATENICTHKVYALKEISKKHVKHANLFHLVMNERNILAMNDSPFVLGLTAAFQTTVDLNLLFDICTGGDLRYHLKKSKTFALDRARFYAAEVLLGIEALHSKGVVYRDLKPDNVLLDENGHCRISDLGLAAVLPNGKKLRERAGTPGFWAPEVVAKKSYECEVDWFSWGVMLYEFLCGSRPRCRCNKDSNDWCVWIGSDSHEEKAVAGHPAKLVIDYPEQYFSAEAKDLLEKVMEADPEKRLKSSVEIRSHPFFSSINWVALAEMELMPPYIPSSKEVHAGSIDDVGTANESKYKNVVIEQSDIENYDKFLYVNEIRIQSDLVNCLKKAEFFNVKVGDVSSEGCCVIL